MEKGTSGKVSNFQCSLCPSRFNRKSSLTRHIQCHVKEQILECNQCAYATGDHSDLARHVKAVHEELTPFKCTFPGCSYKSAKGLNLQRHRLTHETDPSVRRPFPCTFEGCDYRATQKHNLGRPIQSRHNDNRAKSFVCSLCSAAFYDQGNLQEHIRVFHTQETVHNCGICEYKSPYASAVRRHMRLLHGDGGGESIQKRSARLSANSTVQRRRQEKNPYSETSAAPSDEPAQSKTKHKARTARAGKTGDVGGKSMHIFKCTTCHFMAKNEQQALEHSAFNNDHVLLPN